MWLKTEICAMFVPDLLNIWIICLKKILCHVPLVMTCGCKGLSS